MKHVFLPVGPQFVGKSTFCKAIANAFPTVEYVSRDAIFIEMFGTAWIGADKKGYEAGMDKMWSLVGCKLRQSNVVVILDTWNESFTDRLRIVSTLNQMGTDCVDAWCFTTPIETCFEWSLKRVPDETVVFPELPKRSLEERKKHQELIYIDFFTHRIGAELFGRVCEVNPLETNPIEFFRSVCQIS